MTVSNTDSPVKIYTGTATEYPIPFDYISDNDILVTLYNTETGVSTDQTKDVHYTISDETVIYSEAPGSVYNVVIRRVTPYTQEASFGPGEEPPLSTYESCFDKLTMLAQDLDERLGRCIMFPDSYSGTDIELPNPTDNAGKLIRINEDGTGIDVLAVSDSGQATEVTDYCDTADLEELHAAAPSGLVKKRGADITVTVGSGGDYSTINDALAALSAYYPLYVSGGFTAEISLLTGFVMAEQVLVSGIDLSWITITSVDAEVVIDRSALTTAFVSARYPAFGVRRGRLPVIGALFSMDTSGTATDRDGVFLADGSVAVISTGCGVKNAGGTGLNCYRISRALADGANFSGGEHCIACSRGSHVTAREAVLTGGTTRGIYANEGGYIVARSANCQMGASPADTDIVVGNGSTIVAINATGGLSQTANTVAAAGIIYR